MSFLIGYGILALLVFIALFLLTLTALIFDETDSTKQYSLFEIIMYQIDIGRLVAMSFFFPFVCVAIIISLIVTDFSMFEKSKPRK